MNGSMVKVYAVKHRNDSVVQKSRSGGIFTALTDYVLKNQGIVYGCVLDEALSAVHTRADNAVQRDAMRGSKYVQSDTGEAFKQAGKDLAAGKTVLFSGTSCQISGLISYLSSKSVDCQNLLTVDIVCHGVPSPGIWKQNLLWIEKKYNKKIIKADFRNKSKYGWRRHVETYYFDSSEYDAGMYTKLFTRHYILRPSCHVCPYKSTIHRADITIADFWGIERVSKEFDDNKGASLVLVNSDKGRNLFDSISRDIAFKETQIENGMQEPLKRPFPEPEDKAEFWKYYYQNGYFPTIQRYASYNAKQRIIDALPYSLRNKLRTMKIKR